MHLVGMSPFRGTRPGLVLSRILQTRCPHVSSGPPMTACGLRTAVAVHRPQLPFQAAGQVALRPPYQRLTWALQEEVRHGGLDVLVAIRKNI